MMSESITRFVAGKVKVKSGLDPSDQSGNIDTGSDSFVQQDFAKESDINWIVSRYSPEELLSRSDAEPLYGDFSALPSYQEALNTVLEADKMFGDLPAVVRNRFDNDPQQLLDFVADSANQEEAIRLGIAVRREAAKPSDADRIVEAVAALKPASASPGSPS